MIRLIFLRNVFNPSPRVSIDGAVCQFRIFLLLLFSRALKLNNGRKNAQKRKDQFFKYTHYKGNNYCWQVNNYPSSTFKHALKTLTDWGSELLTVKSGLEMDIVQKWSMMLPRVSSPLSSLSLVWRFITRLLTLYQCISWIFLYFKNRFLHWSTLKVITVNVG